MRISANGYIEEDDATYVKKDADIPIRRVPTSTTDNNVAI